MSSEAGLFQKRELSESEQQEKESLMQRGHAAFDDEDFEQALDAYHRASLIDGADWEVWSSLGLTFTNLDFPREAWRSHKLALAADLDNPEAMWYAAEFLFNMEDFDLASFLLERYIQVETEKDRLEEAHSMLEECRAHSSEHEILKGPVLASVAADDEEAETDEDDEELAGFDMDEGAGDEYELEDDEDEDFEDDDYAAAVDDVEDEGEVSFVADMSVQLTGVAAKCSNCGMGLPEDAPYCFSCKAVHFYVK